ncbi:maleylacetate reductase [Actinocorallia herbida]|uniref:Maleylacetate reductase n=1 Tax=Actinocorallia herbida TaxID=58109 RepID=A0A3N1CXZ8_9ACTN|nr:maleylacetate reductase [Actinocorallia herbida]ROO86154.1 maleylacetate reductase [Actinocorallia herbida]
MRDEFVYEAQPMRVVFGAGRLPAVADEARRLGLSRALVVSTPGHEKLALRVADLLGERAAGVFAGARMHVPTPIVAAAREAAARLGADGCVAVGGGSAIGLAKALALRDGLPVIAVPTTYAGSEMTPVWGLTEDGVKRTGRDPAVLPRAVVYDPDLTLTLPPALSVTSGFNALAHAAEALYAPDLSPIVALMAEAGARALIESLPRLVEAPADPPARSRALYGAWLCGAVLGATTMSLHHKLCHVLGGTFDLPHAEVHTVVLPHVLAYNAAAAPDATAALSRVLGSPDPATALWDLARALGAPTSLASLGLRESAIPEIVSQVLATPYANPRPPTAPDLTDLLTHAHQGTAPAP